MENKSLDEHLTVATSSNKNDSTLHNRSTLYSVASVSEGSLQKTSSKCDNKVIERCSNETPKPELHANCQKIVRRTSSLEEAAGEHTENSQNTNPDNITLQVSVTHVGNYDKERMPVTNLEAKSNSLSEKSERNSKVPRVIESSQIGNVKANTCDNDPISPTNVASQDEDFDSVSFWAVFDEFRDSQSNVINTQQCQPARRGVNCGNEYGAGEVNCRTEAENTNENSGSGRIEENMSATVADNGDGRSPEQNGEAVAKSNLPARSSDRKPGVIQSARSDQITRSMSATLKDISSEMSNVSEEDSATVRPLSQTSQPVRRNLPSRKDNSENRPNKIVKESPKMSRFETCRYSQTLTAKDTETLKNRLEERLRTGTLLNATGNLSSQSRPTAPVSATQESSTEPLTSSEKGCSESSDEAPTLPPPPRQPIVLLENPFFRTPKATTTREKLKPVKIKQEKTSPTRESEEPKWVNPFATKRIGEPSNRVSRKRKNSSTEEESSNERRTCGGSRLSRRAAKIPEQSRPSPKRRSLSVGGQSFADKVTEAGGEAEAGPSRLAAERPEDLRKTPSRRKDSPGQNSNLVPGNGLILDDNSDQEPLESPRLQVAAVQEAQPAKLRTSCRVTSNLPASDEESTDNEARRHEALPASWSCLSELMLSSIFSRNASRQVRTPNLPKQVDTTAEVEPCEDVQPEASTSSTIISSPRRSKRRTQREEPPVPTEGTSSARDSSPPRSEQRTHTEQPPIPSEGTSSARDSSPRRCKNRTHTEEASVPSGGTSSARVSSPPRSRRRIQSEEASVPSDGPSSAYPNATHCIAGPLGNIEMFSFDFGYRSGPIRIQVTLIDIYPSLSDFTGSRSVNLLSGFCRSGCHRTTWFSKLVWEPVNGNDSRRNPSCRHCSKEGLSKSVELGFRFIAEVEVPSGERIEVIFTSDFAADFLQCSKEEFWMSETKREDVLNRLQAHIDNKTPINSNLVVVETKSGCHFRAI